MRLVAVVWRLLVDHSSVGVNEFVSAAPSVAPESNSTLGQSGNLSGIVPPRPPAFGNAGCEVKVFPAAGRLAATHLVVERRVLVVRLSDPQYHALVADAWNARRSSPSRRSVCFAKRHRHRSAIVQSPNGSRGTSPTKSR